MLFLSLNPNYVLYLIKFFYLLCFGGSSIFSEKKTLLLQNISIFHLFEWIASERIEWIASGSYFSSLYLVSIKVQTQ
jgi:hypothetical protein